jgi:hypothetical protein
MTTTGPTTALALALGWVTTLSPADQATVARAVHAAEQHPVAGVPVCAVGARGVVPPDGATVEAGGHEWAVWRQRAVNHEGWSLCAMRIGDQGDV